MPVGRMHRIHSGMAELLDVVDLTGFPPGSCAIDFVRDEISPLWIFVWVLESLHVPLC